MSEENKTKGKKPDYIGFINCVGWVQENGELVVKVSPYINLKKSKDKNQTTIDETIETQKISQ